MTTCLDDRFLNNKDMYIYALAEELLIDENISAELRSTKSFEVARILKDIDHHCLTTELAMIQKCRANGDIPPFTSVTDARNYFSTHSSYRLLFTEVLKLIILLTVVPPTSATAERSFSCLKRIKTWLRSSMTQTRLNSVALLHAHRDQEPEIDDVLHEFIGLNDLRRSIFGSGRQ